jgi:hypothetical protein
MQRVPGLETASARLADVVESKAQQLLSKAKGGQALEGEAGGIGGSGQLASGDLGLVPSLPRTASTELCGPAGVAGAGATAAAVAAAAAAAEAASAPAGAPAGGAPAPPPGPSLLLPASVDALGLRQAGRPYNPFGAGCRVCWREADTRRILLCDGCNDEYHCYCLSPPLPDVPEGDFYCAACRAALDAGAAAPPGGRPPTGPPAAAPAARELLVGPRLEEARALAELAAGLEARPYAEWGAGGRSQARLRSPLKRL